MTQRQQPSADAERRVHGRNAVIFLLLAIVLLLLALLLFGNAAPEWNADGSREPYPAWARALVCASVVAGTVMVPLSLRSLVLLLLPHKALAVLLGVLVGAVGLVAAPLEVWLALAITDAEEPGSEERYESGGDWDWD